MSSLKLRCERMMTWLSLIELFFRRRRAYVLLQPPQHAFEFADLSPPPVGVNRKQNRQDHDAYRNGT